MRLLVTAMAEWRCIRQFERRHEAAWAKSLLDAHDIPAMLVHDDAGGWESGLLVPTWARAKLFVRREDLQRSAAVLTDHMTATWREP